MKKILLILLTLLLPGVALAARPNVIVILADDQRADYLGCAGHPVVQTPNIDAIAARGAYFQNAFVTSAACTPSRTSILTGQYERKHGVTFGSGSSLSKTAFAKTYPMVLKKKGYFTGYVGKNHTPAGEGGYRSQLMEEEFDYWYGNHGHSTFYPKKRHKIYSGAKANTQPEIFREGALNFLQENDEFQAANAFLQKRPKEQPFCLLVNFNVPHGAGTSSMKQLPGDPALYRTTYRDQANQKLLVPPKNYVAKTDIQQKKIPAKAYNGEYISQYNYVQTAETLRERQIRTCQTVTGIDNLVGALVAELKRQKIEDNTILLYFADHGLQHGEHGLGGKVLLYEDSVRVPFIIYDPRLPKNCQGLRPEELVLSIDIAPTLLALTDTPAPKGMQGKSLVPLLEGKKVPWRSDFFMENMFMGQNYPRIEAVRTQRWKYIRYFDKKLDQPHIKSLFASIQGEKPIYEELYDLQSDPGETKNLAKSQKYATQLAEIQKRCHALLLEARDGDALPDTYRGK